MQHFSVGAGLDPSDVDNVLVAGGNLSLQYGGLFGKASYGGTATVDGTVTFERGSLTQGTSLDFAAAGIALRQLSATLHAQPVNGVTHLEAWGGLFLEGTDDALNVFQVDASVFASTCYLSISAPAQSLVVLNIVGTSATFSGFSTGFSGGIDATGVLFNFVDATGITLSHHGFFGTMLAPQAHVKFSDGSFDGGIYAGSMSGNAEGHLRPLREIHLGPSP
jgi:choice-of-anchor A domain-containing protein